MSILYHSSCHILPIPFVPLFVPSAVGRRLLVFRALAAVTDRSLRPHQRRWNVRVSHRRSAITAGVILGLLLAVTGLVAAQAGTGSLTGTIKDTQAAVLPGATITATNTATGGVRTTVSNESGAYNLPGLPPGAYTLKVELSGFRTYPARKRLGARRFRHPDRRRDGAWWRHRNRNGERGDAHHQHFRCQRRPDHEPRDDRCATGRGPQRGAPAQPAAWRRVHPDDEPQHRRIPGTVRSRGHAPTSRT